MTEKEKQQHTFAERHIKSFALRQGRLTSGQAKAITTGWPQWGIDYQATVSLDFAACFQRQAPTIVEIGFGMGQSLVTMASMHPENNYIGIEVHRPGVGACLKRIADTQITNLRVICHDAVEVIANMIPDSSLSTVQLFFPDPWHKARHNKRRIVQIPFVELLARKLRQYGKLHMATDWRPYAEHMYDVLACVDRFTNLAANGNYINRPADRPLTKFEQRGHNLGHGVWDLLYQRN